MKDEAVSHYIDSSMILRRDGLIAFVLRQNTSWMKDYYSLPAGRVNPNETYLKAAIREASEEAGVTVSPENIRFVHVMHRREGTDWVSVFFEAGEWEGEAYNAEPHMHASLDWLDPNNLPENMVPSIRFAVEQIEKENYYSEFGWD